MSEEATTIMKSLKTAESIFHIAQQRQIPLQEPFTGSMIGFLEVLSPSVEFYTGLVSEFTEADKIRAEDEAQVRYGIETATDEAFYKAGLLEGSSLLDDPHTTPENESSVVTGMTYDKETFLFTADAGTSALTNVVTAYQVAGLRWMQIPHHGSRRNLTESLIETFSPKTAYVSASGNNKHPRRAVVNAFKKMKSNVYSTHYPHGSSLNHHFGTVPTRQGYVVATPLYEKNELAKAVNG